MELEQYTLGETNELISFDSRIENRELATAMIRQAHNEIKILTPNLENPVYVNQELAQSFSRLITQNRHASIKILVNDSTPAVKAGHRLIELSQNFTSRMQIHKTPEEMHEYGEAILLIDNAGYVYKHHGDGFQGQANFNDKLKVREMLQSFDRAWERSKPDSELRRLHI